MASYYYWAFPTGGVCARLAAVCAPGGGGRKQVRMTKPSLGAKRSWRGNGNMLNSHVEEYSSHLCEATHLSLK